MIAANIRLQPKPIRIQLMPDHQASVVNELKSILLAVYLILHRTHIILNRIQTYVHLLSEMPLRPEIYIVF